MRFVILPVYLFLCLIFGGASAGGYLGNLFLQLVAIALIFWALVTKPGRPLRFPERMLGGLVALVCLLIFLQFLPLPLGLWERLPQRGTLGEFDRMAGVIPGPVFLSLIPHESLKSALWLLPALAVLVTMLRLQAYQASQLAWVILTVMAVSVLLGALQIAGGHASPWYFYRITNFGSTVGFFANSNHLATLLLAALPFLAALVAEIRPVDPTKRVAVLGLCGAFVGIAIAGIYANGSLFGYGLVLPVVGASALILAPFASLRRVAAGLLVPLVAIGVIVVLNSHDGQRMLAESSTLSPYVRTAIFANSWTAIGDFMPFGSGLGTFPDIYPLYENAEQTSLTYINHAHNDYLEVLVETGALGGLALAAFFAWWLWRALRIWHAKSVDPFACAAVIASAAILIHSLVDYPLRTAAISTLFAVCCALMARWQDREEVPKIDVWS